MQCPQCGAAVVATANFCPVCGQTLGSASVGTQPTPIAINPAQSMSQANAAIHTATTMVMQRPAVAPFPPTGASEATFTAADVAQFMAGIGKSMVVSQWQRWWWKILIIGILIYTVVSSVFTTTENVFLLPQLFMVGTFLVPIVYTAYLYEDGTLYDVPLSKIALVFFFGGVIGTVSATLLLSRFANTESTGLFGSLPLLTALIVGLCEEPAKLIVVLPFLVRARRSYPTVMHGIVLGAAAGMGFAAFESMGYAFLALVVGGPEAMTESVKLRALLAPLGHGTWTAIFAAALWREQIAGRFPLTLNVLLAYLVAATLHMSWNYLPSINVPLINVPLFHIIIGIVGLLILRFFLQVARGATSGAYGEQNLARALRIYFGGLRGEMRNKVRGPRA